MTKKSSTKSWYGVRCVFAVAENKPWGPRDAPAYLDHFFDTGSEVGREST